MALSLRGRSGDLPSAPPAGPPGPDTGAEPTYIDAGSELVGQLRFRDSVRIDGRVEGEIHADKVVVVGESAVVAAAIHAESVVVHGSVEGDVRVRRKITLHKTARVTGEIQTAGIVVEEGARFRGCILIGDDETAAERAPRESATATLPLPDAKDAPANA